MGSVALSWVALTLTLLSPGWAAVPAPDDPVYLPLGTAAYATVFEKVLDVVGDHFEIAYSNRYDGRIETFPRSSLALGQPGKVGSIRGLLEGVIAPLVGERDRSEVLIRPAEDGGFFIEVRVFRERKAAAPAEGPAPAATWVPVGRNAALEQAIRGRLAEIDGSPAP